MSRKKRAREIQDAIRRVLLLEWDPIGVAGVAEAQDEYDSYVGGVYRLLAEGAVPERLAEHLHAIKRDAMGLSYRGEAELLPVARKLCELDVRVDGEGAS